MKTFKALLAVLALSTMIACGGGGGSTSTGGYYMSHSEVAKEFVRRVNIDLGWDVSLVKTNTLQYDYIVVYDYDYGTYDAYYIGNYNAGENLSSYVNFYNYKFYYDLVPESGNTYYDWYTGIRFQKAAASSKNLSVVKAFKQDLAIVKAAEKVHAKYGLSEEKSLEVARFAYNVQSKPEGTYKMADFDNFTKRLTGSTITEFQSDLKSGNILSLNDRIQKAAQETGMGPENMNKLIKDVFMN